MMKIAFVIPWYGNIPGGAETECRLTAEKLHAHGLEVEILTTCVQQFLSDWNTDYYQEGSYEENGLLVRRFSVNNRNTQLFDQINAKLMQNQSITLEEENLFMQNMINSDNLYQYIRKHKDEYAYFLFIPYMFGTTYYGANIDPDKSILIPCLHDESYAYMHIFKDLFSKIKGIVYNSSAEKELAHEIYDLNCQEAILGVGINTNISGNAENFKKKYGINSDFILYAGRKDPGKNTLLLIDYFCRYKDLENSTLKLVLVGKGEVDIPVAYRNDIIDLGFISEQDKYDAYSAATIFCMPSVNESFSIVIMEAWLCNTAVLVHGDCKVTKDHCINSNGGLYFINYDEFAECINYYISHPDKKKIIAQNGRNYVIKNYSWDIIIKEYKKLLGVN